MTNKLQQLLRAFYQDPDNADAAKKAAAECGRHFGYNLQEAQEDPRQLNAEMRMREALDRFINFRFSYIPRVFIECRALEEEILEWGLERESLSSDYAPALPVVGFWTPVSSYDTAHIQDVFMNGSIGPSPDDFEDYDEYEEAREEWIADGHIEDNQLEVMGWEALTLPDTGQLLGFWAKEIGEELILATNNSMVSDDWARLYHAFGLEWHLE